MLTATFAFGALHRKVFSKELKATSTLPHLAQCRA